MTIHGTVFGLPDLWTASKWVWNNFTTIAQVIGTVSILMATLDKAIDKMVAKYPASGFWRHLDAAWDGAPGVLGKVVAVLYKLALNRTGNGASGA
jgi:hypothetical protein